MIRRTRRTYIEMIGNLQTVDNFTGLMVNNSNFALACVNLKDMEEAGAPCLFLSLNKFFHDLMDSKFQTWRRNNDGNQKHILFTLFNGISANGA